MFSINKTLKTLAISFLILLFIQIVIIRLFSTLILFQYIYIFIAILFMALLYTLIFSPIFIIAFYIFRKNNKLHKIILAILLFISFSFSILGFVELYTSYKTTYLEIATDNINLKNKKYLFLADPQFSIATQATHAKNISKAIKEIKAKENIEAIFIAGDMFNGEELDWEKIQREMATWQESAPVYFVIGNHEYYGDTENFIRLIKNSNIQILYNESLSLNGVNIYGLSYPKTLKDRENYYRAMLENLKEKKHDILFMHEPPIEILDYLVDTHISFIFTGHTHNGQFWPLNYMVKLQYKNLSFGKKEIGNTVFYTTSGLGISLLPNRLFNPPEMVVVSFY